MSVDASPDADADLTRDVDLSGDGDIETANTMRERANESRLKLWLVLNANRLLVTGVLAVGVFTAFVLLGTFAFPSFVTNLNSKDTIGTMFSTMLSVVATGSTLVVTINQLVLSQENGPLGDQRERMSETMDFRKYSASLYEHPTPADPSAFLRALVNAAQTRADALRDAVTGNEDLERDVEEFTDSLTENADEVRDELEGATFGEFDVVFAALNFNYGWKIFQVERLEHEYADSIDEETSALFEELRSSLAMFGPAREHIKTLYFEWALVDLSQLIVYAAVPALVVAGGMVAFFGSGGIHGGTLGVANVLWLVAAAFTVSLLPFLLFVSYIMRIATLAKRTLAIGPFILRGSQR
jgi:hypothetical protein